MSVQNRYGLDVQAPATEEVIRHCGESGIAFVPFFAIAGDVGARGAPTVHSGEILAIAAAHDASPAQIRLAWSLAQGEHVLAIPGTGNPDHVVENVAAGALRLTADELARLDAARSD